MPDRAYPRRCEGSPSRCGSAAARAPSSCAPGDDYTGRSIPGTLGPLAALALAGLLLQGICAPPARADIDLSPLRTQAGASADDLRSRAQAGDPQAQYRLAQQFDGAQGRKPDPRQAFQWYKRAAEQGHVLAQVNLALMYQAGQGTRRNLAEAVAWFERAASAGHPGAQHSLGLVYYEGLGVKRDYLRARQWFERAAAGGNAASMNNLGVIHALGQGTAEDRVDALAWFRLSAAAGDADGKNNGDLLAAELTPAQLEAGRARTEALAERLREQRQSIQK